MIRLSHRLELLAHEPPRSHSTVGWSRSDTARNRSATPRPRNSDHPRNNFPNRLWSHLTAQVCPGPRHLLSCGRGAGQSRLKHERNYIGHHTAFKPWDQGEDLYSMPKRYFLLVKLNPEVSNLLSKVLDFMTRSMAVAQLKWVVV